MRTFYTVGLLAIVMLVGGCQQHPIQTTRKQQFQSRANQLINKMSMSVYRGLHGYAPQLASLSRGGSPPFVPSGEIGGTYTQDLSQEIRTCVTGVQGIDNSIVGYVQSGSILVRCLDRLLVNRNPLMLYAARNFDDETFQRFVYLMNYRGSAALPGPVPTSGGGSNNDFGMDLLTSLLLDPSILGD
jgi:hypothetical protein